MEVLNSAQQNIVSHYHGPALVIAGAGSGKTRVITHRVAELIRSGIDPSTIMLLTFTNKAAKEMANRVAQATNQQKIEHAMIHGTFHSVANRFLRRHAKLLLYENNFSILDSSDSRDLLKAAVAESIGKPSKNFPKAAVLQNIFSLAFNQNCDVATLERTEYLQRYFDLELLVEQQYPHFYPLIPEIRMIHASYRHKKRRNNALDFDDLLENWLDLLLKKQKSLPWVEQIQFILVDEYQDTNKVQASILDRLAQEHKNLMVVGDDAQSIYSWRGANFKNILDFPVRYNAAVYRLEQNYRSTPDILALANSSINQNKEQFQKELYSLLPNLERPALYRLYDLESEAEIVVGRILELKDQNISLNEMSVLYRNHVQSATLQVALTQRGIPYIVRSGVQFFEQAHMKDIVSFLKIIFNPLDEIAWMRVLKLIPGVGNTTAQKIFHVFLEQKAVRLTFDNVELQKKIPKKAKVAWEQLLICFKRLLEEGTTPSQMVAIVYQMIYRDYLFVSYENAVQREADIAYLEEFAGKYKSLERLLNELSLVGTTAIKDYEAERFQEDECLTLTTIHQAKGLEWNVVFVIGLTEGQFPHQRCLEPPSRLEEERRLFYVAMTRARRYLTLTAPIVSSSFGANTLSSRSRFIEECPQTLMSCVTTPGTEDMSYSNYKARFTF
ncbi:MAG: ATP-dependent helicase [SAR324 cluster bacterium]|nr:ATP-dependent helicase [SAR324 cluster bacterium]